MRFTAASRSCLRTRTVPLLGILGRADGDYEEGQVICRGCAWSKYPDSRQRDVQILTGFENARDRLTSESLEAPAIDASTLTPEKRHDIAHSLAICKAEDITKEVMPWEVALDRINLTNFGVDIPQILAHFRPNSRQRWPTTAALRLFDKP